MTKTLKTIAVSAKGLPWPMGSNLHAVMTRVALLLLSCSGFLLPMITAQSGFLGIDCGNSYEYPGLLTGLQWYTDEPYISTGINTNVSKYNLGSFTNFRQMTNRREFPEKRKKNCYILPVDSNSSYLIRAMFFYGGELSPPAGYSFNLSIDSTIVGSVNITQSDMYEKRILEFLVASTSDQIAFCIIPVVGVPFISSLEVRKLLRTMYQGLMFESKYMKSLYRSDCGSTMLYPVRFNVSSPTNDQDDKYDRLWNPDTTSTGTSTNTGTSANTSIYTTSTALDQPPVKVMQTAWIGTMENGLRLNWTWNVNQIPSTRFYIALYFADIGTRTSTDVRSIDVALNGASWRTGYAIEADGSELQQSEYEITTNTADFHLTANPNSTLPPLLNAAELYAIYDIVTATTKPGEVLALDDIRKSLNLLDWTGDPCLPVSWDWLDCSSTEIPVVTRLKLSNYNLYGTIPASIANLTNLTDLWLDNNLLSGSIPDLIALTRLKTLHLQNNSLTGRIPASLANIAGLSELFLEDNDLSGSVPAGLQDKSKNGSLKLQVDRLSTSSGKSGAVIGVVIGVLVVVILVVLFVLLWCRRRSKAKAQSHAGKQAGAHKRGDSAFSDPSNKSSLRGGHSGSHVIVQMTQAFSLAEVETATENFKWKIGQGGFGPVYHGKLATGEEVALKVNSATSGQGWHEFSNEVSLLSRVHHRNLVSLVGFCHEDDKQILIYEYMQNGTLREHLYGKGLTKTLDWHTRLGIALDAARGLEYLHYDCHPRIIHRDVKSNNILLNEKLVAKVADFGISKLSPEEDTAVGISTAVQGTYGYLDPEYFATNKITPKSDVYAFGVVLLEIVSGRPPNDAKLAETEQYNVVVYARGMLQRDGDLEGLVDPSLMGSYNVKAMEKLTKLAMCCVEPVGKSRPNMRQVVRDLTEAFNLEHQEHQEDLAFTNPMAPGVGDVNAFLEGHDTSSSSAFTYTFGSSNSGTQSPHPDPATRSTRYS